jgi:predicted small lipoprotein YifL
MIKRVGSVVAWIARAFGLAAFAFVAACGQKGPLIGVKPAAPPIVRDVAPDASIAVPASLPASASAPR